MVYSSLFHDRAYPGKQVSDFSLYLRSNFRKYEQISEKRWVEIFKSLIWVGNYAATKEERMNALKAFYPRNTDFARKPVTQGQVEEDGDDYAREYSPEELYRMMV